MKIRTKLLLLIALLFMTSMLILACGSANEDAPPNDPANDPSNQENDVENGGNDGNNATAGDDTLVAHGEQVVRQTCISCHGNDLQGGSGPSLYGVSEDYSEEELHDILVNGIGSMPGGLAAGDEDAVVAFLLTLEE